jgi:hypothetical protein
MRKETIEERQRSARKQAEIDNEVNANKEAVYQYVVARKDVSGKECVEALQLFEKGKRYLEWLALKGHLVRMKRTINGSRQYVYNAGIPYVKPTPVHIPKEEIEAANMIAQVTRVYRLLDREHLPQPKTKKKVEVHIGSSMRMFGSW